jgi:hypothetical protein
MAKYELKTKKNDEDVYKFLLSVEDEQKREDSLKIAKIMAEITGEEPKMWGKSIVGFGSYHYKYASGQEGDWMLIGFSPRKQSLTLYIMSGFGEYAKATGYDPKPLMNKLGKHSTGKSCLYIKTLKDVDINVLKQLIKKSSEHMKSLNK